MNKPLVLFLCTANSARSQMAEAFLRRYAAGRYEAASAGLAPTEVHPLAKRVMAEVGIDLTGHRSKSVREFLGRVNPAYVIFVCERARQLCPSAFPATAATFLAWPIDDPVQAAGSEEERLRKFREVRDQIHGRIRSWLAATDENSRGASRNL